MGAAMGRNRTRSGQRPVPEATTRMGALRRLSVEAAVMPDEAPPLPTTTTTTTTTNDTEDLPTLLNGYGVFSEALKAMRGRRQGGRPLPKMPKLVLGSPSTSTIEEKVEPEELNTAVEPDTDDDDDEEEEDEMATAIEPDELEAEGAQSAEMLSLLITSFEGASVIVQQILGLDHESDDDDDDDNDDNDDDDRSSTSLVGLSPIRPEGEPEYLDEFGDVENEGPVRDEGDHDSGDDKSTSSLATTLPPHDQSFLDHPIDDEENVHDEQDNEGGDGGDDLLHRLLHEFADNREPGVGEEEEKDEEEKDDDEKGDDGGDDQPGGGLHRTLRASVGRRSSIREEDEVEEGVINENEDGDVGPGGGFRRTLRAPVDRRELQDIVGPVVTDSEEHQKEERDEDGEGEGGQEEKNDEVEDDGTGGYYDEEEFGGGQEEVDDDVEDDGKAGSLSSIRPDDTTVYLFSPPLSEPSMESEPTSEAPSSRIVEQLYDFTLNPGSSSDESILMGSNGDEVPRRTPEALSSSTTSSKRSSNLRVHVAAEEPDTPDEHIHLAYIGDEDDDDREDVLEDDGDEQRSTTSLATTISKNASPLHLKDSETNGPLEGQDQQGLEGSPASPSLASSNGVQLDGMVTPEGSDYDSDDHDGDDEDEDDEDSGADSRSSSSLTSTIAQIGSPLPMNPEEVARRRQAQNQRITRMAAFRRRWAGEEDTFEWIRRTSRRTAVVDQLAPPVNDEGQDDDGDDRSTTTSLATTLPRNASPLHLQDVEAADGVNAMDVGSEPGEEGDSGEDVRDGEDEERRPRDEGQAEATDGAQAEPIAQHRRAVKRSTSSSTSTDSSPTKRRKAESIEMQRKRKAGDNGDATSPKRRRDADSSNSSNDDGDRTPSTPSLDSTQDEEEIEDVFEAPMEIPDHHDAVGDVGQAVDGVFEAFYEEPERNEDLGDSNDEDNRSSDDEDVAGDAHVDELVHDAEDAEDGNSDGSDITIVVVVPPGRRLQPPARPRWARQGRRMQRIDVVVRAAPAANDAGDANLEPSWNAEEAIRAAIARIQRFHESICEALSDGRDLPMEVIIALGEHRQQATRSRTTLRRLLEQEQRTQGVDEGRVAAIVQSLIRKTAGCAVLF